jgi:hypothetical protein
MAEPAPLREIAVDLTANTLRLSFRDGTVSGETDAEPATIEVGTGGRLVGIELAAGYVDVMEAEPGTEHLTRRAAAEVAVERERGSGALVAMTLPRRGAGYEITYPSGNQ